MTCLASVGSGGGGVEVRFRKLPWLPGLLDFVSVKGSLPLLGLTLPIVDLFGEMAADFVSMPTEVMICFGFISLSSSSADNNVCVPSVVDSYGRFVSDASFGFCNSSVVGGSAFASIGWNGRLAFFGGGVSSFC